MSLKGKEALHMYQIGIDIGGTNVKIGLLDEALELTAEIQSANLYTKFCLLHHSVFP